MQTSLRFTRCWPALLLLLGPVVTAQANDPEGVVRLGGHPSLEDQVVRGQSPGAYCPPEYYVECPPYYGPAPYPYHSVFGDNLVADHLRDHAMNFRMRNQLASSQLSFSFQQCCREHGQLLRHKFGYFIPTGCCGRGCPPIGHYSMVYPLDPNYFDQRDGNIYAAHGTGGPVSVPLAPNVRHTYNYGWGVPSSRLTPVSHPYPGY